MGLRPTKGDEELAAWYGGLQPARGFSPAWGWFFNRAVVSDTAPLTRPAPHFHPSLWPCGPVELSHGRGAVVFSSTITTSNGWSVTLTSECRAAVSA